MNNPKVNAQNRRKRSNEKYMLNEKRLIGILCETERVEFYKFLENLFSKEFLIEGEFWVELKDWENYKISNYGRILNKQTNKIKTPHLHHSGYYTISMHKNVGAKYYILSRLIGLHFVQNPNNLPEINHKNKIRRDNRITNIEWNLSVENSKHRMIGLEYDKRRPIIQLDLNNVIIKEWNSIYDAAKTLSVSAGNIITTIQGKHKHAYGYKWKYKTA